MIATLLKLARRTSSSSSSAAVAATSPLPLNHVSRVEGVLETWLEMLGELPNQLPVLLNQWADPAILRQSGLTPLDLLPVREALAANKYPNHLELALAFELALDQAVQNSRPLSGRTHVALDTSGSMTGAPVRAGALLTATLAQTNPDTEISVFDTKPRRVTLNKAETLEEKCQSLEAQVRMSPTSFTDMLQAFSKKADRLIMLTDMPYFLEDISARRAWQNWQTAAATVDKLPQLWIVDVTGNGPESSPMSGVTIWNGVSQDLIAAMG